MKKKFKPSLHVASLIKGINILMNNREFDDFFESYDAIFEKENEKLIAGGYLDDSESNIKKLLN